MERTRRSGSSQKGPDERQGGLPRNYLQACLLLLIGECPAHGYDLLEQIRGLGLRGVDAGGLYRALRAMERAGWLESWWQHSSAGPARRTYRLSREGMEWLHVWAGALAESRRYLSAYLARYEEAAAAEPPAGSSSPPGSTVP